MSLPVLLSADDDENDTFFIQRASARFTHLFALRQVADGRAAIDYLLGRHDFADRSRFPLPALLLLDLKMPRATGIEVVRWVREQDAFRYLPVVMLTSSSRGEDVELARQAGADVYFTKPPRPQELAQRLEALLPALQGDRRCLSFVANNLLIDSR